MNEYNTISLIGMPAAGKSTVGVILAKQTGLRFIDTDLDIQVREGATLQEIVDTRGYRYLREVEHEVLMALELDHALVSTGGSVVYSDDVMVRLKAAGPVVYLEADLATLEQRIASAPPRGIASESDAGFPFVYAERTPLYEHYADVRVNACAGTADQVARTILDSLP